MAHRYNPFTGRDLGTREDRTNSQNSRTSHNRTSDRNRQHPQEQEINTTQTYGNFPQNSAYAPPTPGSINPFSYDAYRSRTVVDRNQNQNVECARGYGARPPSFPASPEPAYLASRESRTPFGRGSRYAEQNSTSGHRSAALSALTSGAQESSRHQPSAWHVREEDVEIRELPREDWKDVDIEAQGGGQVPSQSRNRKADEEVIHTYTFWNSTANTAPDRTCWQGFQQNPCSDVVGLSVVLLSFVGLVVIFFAVNGWYADPAHFPAGE